MYKIISAATKHTWFFSFPIRSPFNFYIFIFALTGHYLRCQTRVGKVSILYIVPCFFEILYISLHLAWRCWQDAEFIMLEYVPCSLSISSNYIMKQWWIFVKSLFPLSKKILWLSLSLFMWWITVIDLRILKNLCVPENWELRYDSTLLSPPDNWQSGQQWTSKKRQHLQ